MPRVLGRLLDRAGTVGWDRGGVPFRVGWGRREVTSIPLVDLSAQHAAVAEEVAEGWQEVLARTTFIGGPQVAAFEREYAEFIGVAHCVAMANGTDAIEIALRALGVGRGDECILPANTFIATAEAVSRAGGTPVLVDCADDETYLIDTDAVEDAVTLRTRAIIPVHLYGQAAPVERLLPLARRMNISLVEDAAQAQGARRNGTSAGVLGDAAATSFYPGKNLGAYGDAGAALTDSDELAARMPMIREHGSARKYEHDVLGVNSRLDTLQAVVLSAKLRRLAGWNAARRAAAARYDGAGAAPGPGAQRVARGWYRRGNPLSGAHTSDRRICGAGIRGGCLPRGRADRARTAEPAPPSRDHRGAAGARGFGALVSAVAARVAAFLPGGGHDGSAPDVARHVEHDARAQAVQLHRQFPHIRQARSHRPLALHGADDEQEAAAAGPGELGA